MPTRMPARRAEGPWQRKTASAACPYPVYSPTHGRARTDVPQRRETCNGPILSWNLKSNWTRAVKCEAEILLRRPNIVQAQLGFHPFFKENTLRENGESASRLDTGPSVWVAQHLLQDFRIINCSMITRPVGSTSQLSSLCLMLWLHKIWAKAPA